MKKPNENLSYFKRFRFMSSFLMLMMLGLTLQAQTTSYTLRGNVTDNIGDTVPGVSVQIKNTNLGEITDLSGNYNLKVNLNTGSYTLVFRSIGLTTQEVKITLGTEAEVVNNVVMTTDILGLDEIVITGAGALTAKKHFTFT